MQRFVVHNSIQVVFLRDSFPKIIIEQLFLRTPLEDVFRKSKKKFIKLAIFNGNLVCNIVTCEIVCKIMLNVQAL